MSATIAPSLVSGLSYRLFPGEHPWDVGKRLVKLTDSLATIAGDLTINRRDLPTQAEEALTRRVRDFIPRFTQDVSQRAALGLGGAVVGAGAGRALAALLPRITPKERPSHDDMYAYYAKRKRRENLVGLITALGAGAGGIGSTMLLADKLPDAWKGFGAKKET
jgi:hypothetical protein